MAAAIRDGVDGPAQVAKKPRPTPKAKIPETPEQKAYKAKVQEKKDALGRLKALFSKGRKETNEATGQLEIVRSKRYPEAFVNRLQDEIGKMQAVVEDSASTFANILIDEEQGTSGEVEAKIREVQKSYDKLVDQLTKSRLGVLADCKKLGGGKAT